MDYEKKYKEALEKARQLCAYPTSKPFISDLQDLFPELAESEDDRIRKELIHLFQSDTPQQFGEFTNEQFIAWLEKQGEKKYTQRDIDDAYLKGIADVKREVKKIDEQTEKMKKEIAEFIFNSKEDIKQRYEWIKCLGFDVKFSNEEKQGEQKSTDKVEPKFKVGDWVFIEQIDNIINGPRKIKEVDYYGYVLDGIREVTLPFTSEHCMRLWTIQDAKDGDVLAYVTDEEDLWIMIYWSLYEPYEGHVHYHALLVNDNFYDKGTCCICIDNLKPVTKEQYDLLFQKMKEAGYEWDAKKKELKKIEQIPTDKIEPIFNVGDKIQYSKGCGTIMTIEKIENGEYVFANNMGHTTIEWGNKWYLVNPVEQKPAWSEEDEEMLKSIIATCELAEQDRDSSPARHLFEMQADWLKSIKDRVQPKQEWSEEDEKILNTIISFLSEYSAKGYENAIMCIDWLKSLKFR